MLEQIAWNTFESTGNIEAYILYRQLEQEQIDNNQNEINDGIICTV